MLSTLQFPSFAGLRQGFFAPSATGMQSEIKTFAAKADNLADQILAQNTPKEYTGPVVIHDHHYYQPWYWPTFWYDPSPRYVVIDNRSSSRDERKKDNSAAIALIGIVSAVVAGVAVYSLGSSVAAYNDANEELNETYEFQEKLNFSPKNTGQKDQEKIDQAYQIANLKGRICSRIRNSAISDIILKGSLFASSAVALTGAIGAATVTIAAAPALMTGGAIAGLVSTGGLLFKWGVDTTDKSNMRDAQALKASVQELRNI